MATASPGGAGWLFDVSYYSGDSQPADGFIETLSDGMGMDNFVPATWVVTERPRSGFTDLGGFAHEGFSIGDDVDPFSVCTRETNGSIEELTANLSSSSLALTIDGVHVNLDAGELVIVCWFNEGDTPPPPPPPPPPPTVTITITKQVTADAGAEPPAGTLYAFELRCNTQNSSFTLADGQSKSSQVVLGSTCSLTETDTKGADSVMGEFSGEVLGTDRSFTVVNDYEGVVVLGTAITKLLTSADPAAVGARVSFDVTVTFEGTLLPNAEFVDVYENEFLSFESATSGLAPVACQVFASMPDAAHDMVVCPAGDLSGPATLTMHFTALKGTLGDRTFDEAKVVSDLDGPGGDQPLMIGPAFDDVEIVEVLALPPLGDGSLSGQGGAPLALVVALAALAVASAATARRLVREGARA